MEMDRKKEREAEGENKERKRKRDTHTERETHGQTDRQIDKQTARLRASQNHVKKRK